MTHHVTTLHLDAQATPGGAYFRETVEVAGRPGERFEILMGQGYLPQVRLRGTDPPLHLLPRGESAYLASLCRDCPTGTALATPAGLTRLRAAMQEDRNALLSTLLPPGCEVPHTRSACSMEHVPGVPETDSGPNRTA